MNNTLNGSSFDGSKLEEKGKEIIVQFANRETNRCFDIYYRRKPFEMFLDNYSYFDCIIKSIDTDDKANKFVAEYSQKR